jgi:MraZ protein
VVRSGKKLVATKKNMTYRGTHLANLDEKNRLSVPKKIRDKLSPKTSLILTAHPDKCLLLYKTKDWFPVEKRIMTLSSFNKKSNVLQRLLVGYADEVQMDNAGRVLISQTLKHFSQIKHECIFVGQGSHYEIWDKDSWDKFILGGLKQNLDLNDPELEGFNL